MTKLIYPDLSYEIVGALYSERGIEFKEQLPIKLRYKGENLGILVCFGKNGLIYKRILQGS